MRIGLIALTAGTVVMMAGMSMLGAAPVGYTSPPLFLNTSTSLPRGWYRITKSADLARGQVLRLCLPASLGRYAIERGYVRSGTCAGGAARVGKSIVALAGDSVAVRADGIQVNDDAAIRVQMQARDRRGRRMATATGTYVLGDGECFLLSRHSPFSFDSRYFGPVSCGEPPYSILTHYGAAASAD